jgi:ferredoxin-NADP reductase
VSQEESGLFGLRFPDAMMDAVERALRGLGVPQSRIVAERFEYD